MKVVTDNYTKRTTCPYCRSVIEFNRDDVSNLSYESRITGCGRGINPITVKCGACGKPISLGYNESEALQEGNKQ